MAQSSKVVRANLPDTAGGTVDFTSAGFGTPAAALIFFCNGNATNNPQDGSVIGVGFWDGTSQRCISVRGSDNVASTSALRSSDNSYGALSPGSAPGSPTAYTVSSTTNGITLTLSVDNTGVQRYCTVVLLKGVSAAVGTLTPNATQDATQASASLGFAPRLVFFASIGSTTADVDSAATSHLSFGFAEENAVQRAIVWRTENASTPEAASVKFCTDRCLGVLGSGALNFSAEATTFGPDTFTVTTRDGANGTGILGFYLALGGADLSYDCGTLTTRTSTGDDVNATAVSPAALLLMLCGASGTTRATDSQANSLSFGLADDDGEFSHNIFCEDSANPTNCGAVAKAAQCVDLDGSSGGARTDLCDATATLNSSDFTLNYTVADATARKGWWVAFGDAPPATSYTFTGPSGSYVDHPTGNFTVTLNGLPTGTITITPATDGSGTFTPSSLDFSGSTISGTFTYTPSSTSGTPHTLSVTNNGGLTNAASLDVAVSSVTPVDDEFESDTDGWTISAGSPTQVASEGATLSDGYLQVGASVQMHKEFTEATAGLLRVEHWFYSPDSTVSASASHRLYAFPDTGTTVTDANAVFGISWNRDSGAYAGVDSNSIAITRYDGDSTPTLYKAVRRGAWWKVAVVVDISARTYDVYLNDILYTRGIACPNTTFTGIKRLSIVSEASSPNAYFDAIKVQAHWDVTDNESVLIEDDFTASPTGAIEDSTPDTDGRNIYPQPWMVPVNTAANFDGFTRGASGLTPNSAKACYAFARCGPEGVFVTTWTTSPAGVIGFGQLQRCYAGQLEDGWARVDYVSNRSSGQKLRLVQGSNTWAQADPTITISANTTYTLKVVVRGRYYWVYLKAGADNADADDVTGFSLQLSGPFLDNSAVTGGRGILSEEPAGPYVNCNTGQAATDNLCTRFRYFGRTLSPRADATIGGYTVNLDPGSIRELYVAASGVPTRNYFWSKGIQFGHRPRADMGNYATTMQTIYDSTNVKVYRQRSLNCEETTFTGWSDCYITLLRRGPYVADLTKVWGNAVSIAPDNDHRQDLFSKSYKVVSSAGVVTDITDSAYQDWRADLSGQGAGTGVQRVSSHTGDDVRLTHVYRNNLNWSGSVHPAQHKWEGDGDPISHQIYRPEGNLVDGTSYEVGRAWLIETGAAIALSSTVLQDFRTDINTPATLSMTTGTLTTNAAGDLDTDGYNERYGWYEIACAGGLATFTVPISSGKRFGLAFRLTGWSANNTGVKIAGATGVRNTDYTIDSLGGGVAVLQLLSDRTADTSIELVSGGVSRRMNNRLLRPF